MKTTTTPQTRSADQTPTEEKHMKIDVTEDKEIVIIKGNNKITIGGDGDYALNINGKFRVKWSGEVEK